MALAGAPAAFGPRTPCGVHLAINFLFSFHRVQRDSDAEGAGAAAVVAASFLPTRAALTLAARACTETKTRRGGFTLSQKECNAYQRR